VQRAFSRGLDLRVFQQPRLIATTDKTTDVKQGLCCDLVLRPGTLAPSEYLAARRAKSVPDYKIEPDPLSKRHEARIRLASWGTVLSLFAMTVLVFVLCFRGLLTAQSNLKWLAAFALLGLVIGSCVLTGLEALRRAEREMVFVIDENAVVRKRKGWPDERIVFSEVSAIREELRWQVVESTEPYRKMAIPNDIKGYQAIRADQRPIPKNPFKPMIRIGPGGEGAG
jgi:hypothetical protein